ncbi:MAG: DUF296 domain-containing protein [Candidatus Lokiarchaeota archaeon]|nr:DUF296 domain-containing protein [Candidatus Lokiarchaeota archaeon]
MVKSIITKPKRIIVARLSPGEDVLDTVTKLAVENEVTSGQLTLIGAVGSAHLGYFDTEDKTYKSFQLDEDLEVVSCMGNIANHPEGIIIHAHMIVANEDGKCYGGHLMTGTKVSVTIEVIIIETEDTFSRAKDAQTGLNLLNL